VDVDVVGARGDEVHDASIRFDERCEHFATQLHDGLGGFHGFRHTSRLHYSPTTERS